MSSYKLIYFDLRGRAEVIRMLFAVAGQEYEDFRIVRSEWDEWRPKVPALFGHVPILEVDGKTLTQSHTIEKFLANRFGLSGKTEWDKAQCDMILNAMEDIIKPTVLVRYETDETKKKLLQAKSIEGFEKSMGYFSKLLQSNKTGSGFFVGNEMTVADIAFFHYPSFDEIFLEFKVDWTKWPNLQALREKVASHEKIKEWLQKRPDNWI